jgi:hypothetical protein
MWIVYEKKRVVVAYETKVMYPNIESERNQEKQKRNYNSIFSCSMLRIHSIFLQNTDCLKNTGQMQS